MGMKFRKSTKIGPFRTTISKSGISYSAGVKGFRVTKQANGKVRTTASIPGTGISYTSVSGKASKSAKANVPVASVKEKKKPKNQLHVIFFVLAVLLLLASASEPMCIIFSIACLVCGLIIRKKAIPADNPHDTE